jgi:hypothetical protein
MVVQSVSAQRARVNRCDAAPEAEKSDGFTLTAYNTSTGSVGRHEMRSAII